MLAGLLHDIGHGPFSHAFEGISMYKHEEYTVKIITENSEIHQILAACDARLPEDVASIIQYRHPKIIFCGMPILQGPAMENLIWNEF